ncbi:MAG: CCA tRNA nucleotidyltransferase [Flavobacteriales bacterium]
MHPALSHPVFEIVRQSAESIGLKAYVIGGYVRDYLLGRPCKDIDFVTEGSGIALAEEVARRLGPETHVSVFKNFGTAMLHFEDYEIEFVGARKESYRSDSRKPIVENGTIEEDQARRDFTINALAIDLSNPDEIIDPFGGLTHLKEKRLKTPLGPETTFSDDPLRMMRAIRFATQLNFEIDGNTLSGIEAKADRIKIVSKERIADELNKIILSPVPSKGFKLLDKTGILRIIFPEFTALKGVEVINGKAHKDNFYHTLKVLDNLSNSTDNLWLRWAALLHDIAKPLTKRFDLQHGWTFHGHEDRGAKMVPHIFRNLKLPQNEKMRYVQKLVQLHLRPIALTKEEVTDSAVRRLLFEAGDDVDDLMLLCKADITSKNEDKVKRYLSNYELVKHKLKEIEEKDHLRNWQPPVTGEDIMYFFDIAPGKEVGLIKNAIREAILEGEISNTRQAALQVMKNTGLSLGLTLIHEPQTE